MFIIKTFLSALLVVVLVILGYFYLPVTNDKYFVSGKNIDCLIYNNGRIETQRTFESSSEFHKVVNDYLEEVEGGWNRSPVTYAPTIYIRSEELTLVVWEHMLIFGSESGQFIKKVNNTEFAYSIRTMCES